MMLIKEKIKILISGVIVSIFTFLTLFTLLEIFLRVLKIQSDNFIKQDPVLGWTHLANKEGYSRAEEFSVKVRLNKDGFIGRDYDYLKPDHTVRIVVIGDSLTEAFQVEESDSYSRLLENGLKTNFTGTNFEVLNMGIAGYGTEREYYVFRDKGLKFNPNIVLLGFFVGNDFSDNMRENINLDTSFSKYRDFKNKIKLFVRNHSTAWRFILRQKSRNSVWAYFKNKNKINLNGNSGARDNLSEIKIQTDHSVSLIRNLNKLADENGVDLVVAILPSAGQVYPDKDGVADYLLENLSKNLISFLEREKIDHVDLLPYFKDWVKLNSDKLPYLLLDGHLSKYGQQITAASINRYLTDFLKKNGNF